MHGARAALLSSIAACGLYIGAASAAQGTKDYPTRPIRLLIPRGSGDRITAKIVYKGPLAAPVRKGAQVARLQVSRGDFQALDIPLYAGEDVETGSLPQRAVDGLFELGTGLVRRAFSKG